MNSTKNIDNLSFKVSMGSLWGGVPILVLSLGAAFSNNESFELIVYPLVLSFYIFLLLAWFFMKKRRVLQKHELYASKRIYVTLAMFFIAMGVSALIGLNPVQSLFFIIAWMAYCFTFIILPPLITSLRSVRRLVSLNILTAFLLSFIVIVFVSMGIDAEGFKGIMGFNKNSLGIIMFAPFFISLANIITDKKLRLLPLIFIITAVLALTLNLSRGIWLSYLFGVILLLYLIDRKIVIITRVLPVILIIVALILLFDGSFANMGTMLSDRFLSIFNFTDEYADSSNITRYYLLLYSVALLKKYWLLGVGPGEFLAAYSLGDVTHFASNSMKAHRFLLNAHTPHNIFLRVWIEGGLFSLLFFLTFFILLLKWIRKKSMSFFGMWSPNHAGAFVAILVGLFTGFFYESIFDWYFWYNTGMLVVVCKSPVWNMAECKSKRTSHQIVSSSPVAGVKA